MPHIPAELAPNDGETAVLSVLAVQVEAGWAIAAGSLLTVPTEVGGMSWRQWHDVQPTTPARMDHDGDLDPGPEFWVEPFPGIRAIRAVLDAAGWQEVVNGIDKGNTPAVDASYIISVADATPTMFLAQDGSEGAHRVIAGMHRPVMGVVLSLDAPTAPPAEYGWEQDMPTEADLPRGPERGRIWQERHVSGWPRAILGIDWPPGETTPQPPESFVVGRPISTAWIGAIRPEYDAAGDSISISVAWDETKIDPLGCSVLIGSHQAGMPLLVRHQPLSDLPDGGSNQAGVEPRTLSWRERTLDVRLPIGPGSEWGAMLIGPAGELLDEWPVALRVRSIHLQIQPMVPGGAVGPPQVATVGDRKPAPTEAQINDAVRAATESEDAARDAAARRRITTLGDLGAYLRWRFSCREGELLVLDPHLFSSSHASEQEVVEFLASLNRPVRTLAGGLHQAARSALQPAPTIQVKALPDGRRTLHDRVWIVGETAVLVGASVSHLLRGSPARTTTVTDLPHADSAVWRERFEEWWLEAQP
jgi:hypothetical protein